MGFVDVVTGQPAELSSAEREEQTRQAALLATRLADKLFDEVASAAIELLTIYEETTKSPIPGQHPLDPIVVAMERFRLRLVRLGMLPRK